MWMYAYMCDAADPNAEMYVQVVQKALRPGREHPQNPDCMANVTDVWVSGDLQVAKVKISIYNAKGDDMSSRFEQLKHLTGYEVHYCLKHDLLNGINLARCTLVVSVTVLHIRLHLFSL